MNNYYFNIIDNIFINLDNNSNILLIIKNEFNIFDYFQHIIKKKNINIDIIIENIDIVNKITNDINGEECDNNIKLFSNIENIYKKYDIINIFHLDNINYFNNILNKIKDLSNENTLIYIYCSLSNEKEKNIKYKNYFRKIINNYTNINIGNLLKINDIIYTIEDKKYNINSLKIYKNNNYLLYGNNNVYEIIIKKKTI